MGWMQNSMCWIGQVLEYWLAGDIQKAMQPTSLGESLRIVNRTTQECPEFINIQQGPNLHSKRREGGKKQNRKPH